MDVKQETQKIAAVVLFKDLHAKQMDVYDVLAAFISGVIVKKGISRFTTVDMGKDLEEFFGFDSIPQNVIKNAIKRTDITYYKDGYYNVKRDSAFCESGSIGYSLEEEIAKNDKIINNACRFIEEKRGEELTAIEREEITRSFCSFLLDSKCESKYIAEVASYIISLEGTEDQKRIEEITEGVYQYAALTYNEDISKIEKLRNDITIFLDTEALLSLGGFHGEVHKLYIDEMLKLISEINEKTRKRYMSVKYMDYVKQEIDDVFHSAIFYVQGKNFYTRDAGESIAEGCKTVEDVMEKRANFYARLKSKGIIEFKFPDRYSNVNDSFNLEGDGGLQELVSEEITEKDIEKGAKRVSDINKLRKGIQYKNFEEIKYVFVSDNGKVQAVNSYYCKELNSYNFVMGCSKMTNILWLKMNKGLSSAVLPKSLEAITRSRVVVSSFTSAKMRNEMRVMNSKIETGELEQGALYEMLIDFKNYAKRPEEITTDSLDINLHYIESDMKTYGEELSLYKNEAEEERKKKGNIVEAFKSYSKLVEQRDTFINKIKEKELELELLKKRRKIAKIFCNIIKVIIGVICLGIILFMVSLMIRQVKIEFFTRYEVCFQIIIAVLIFFLELVLDKKIKKETLSLRLFNKIEKGVYSLFRGTSEQMDNCKFIIEGNENGLKETEMKMEECKLLLPTSIGIIE